MSFKKNKKQIIEELQNKLKQYLTWVPPGHFYSPIPDINYVKKYEKNIWGKQKDNLPAIDLNIENQIALVKNISSLYKDIPFKEKKVSGLRYYFDNPFFSYNDGIILYCMIRHLKPKRVIEIGSGFSSCITLDVNELYFNNSINCTFVEPYPERLLSLIKENEKVDLIESNLQDIDLEIFEELEENDILFVDSTHVSKINSDVNILFFEIFPKLKENVFIHIHDIHYPFEYQKHWVYAGRAWNENYILRSFLMYNGIFEVVFFNSYLNTFYRELLKEYLPLCLERPGGSIWLKKSVEGKK